MSPRDYGYYYFPPSTPKKVIGGIKAQTKRGGFGQSWWAKRWIKRLEDFNIGARLGRGRSYARNGQVRSIKIEKGLVTAQVQGSRRRPYDIFIHINVLTPPQWKKLAGIFAGQAIITAKLLNGEMPQDIEGAFEGLGLSLFPDKPGDLQTDCSCPDWSNPCKHIAAVYYLLGEEFDRDPFLIFKLRGIERENLIEMMRELTGEAVLSKPAEVDEEEAVSAPEPLMSEMTGFWVGKNLPDNSFGKVAIPRTAAVLLKRLGNFPFWRGNISLTEALEPVYSQASPRGMKVFLGEILRTKGDLT